MTNLTVALARIIKSSSVVRLSPFVTGPSGPTGLTVTDHAAGLVCVIVLDKFYSSRTRLMNVPVAITKSKPVAVIAAVPVIVCGRNGAFGPSALSVATVELRNELAT